MKKLPFFCIYAIMLISGCEKTITGGDGVIDNCNPDDYDLYDYYTDQYGNAGIVAAKNTDAASWVNYIIVLSLDEHVASWGPEGMAVFPVFENFNASYPDSFFFGLQMNQIIEEKGSENFPAFDWCHKKNRDGKAIHSSSWVLPAEADLNIVFSNDTDMLNQALEKAGGRPLCEDDDGQPLYWTATEDIEDFFYFSDETIEKDYDQANRAIPITASNLFPTSMPSWNKSHEYRVRAIKYIYFRCDIE